jgi:hypothetical protein
MKRGSSSAALSAVKTCADAARFADQFSAGGSLRAAPTHSNPTTRIWARKLRPRGGRATGNRGRLLGLRSPTAARRRIRTARKAAIGPGYEYNFACHQMLRSWLDIRFLHVTKFRQNGRRFRFPHSLGEARNLCCLPEAQQFGRHDQFYSRHLSQITESHVQATMGALMTRGGKRLLWRV